MSAGIYNQRPGRIGKNMKYPHHIPFNVYGAPTKKPIGYARSEISELQDTTREDFNRPHRLKTRNIHEGANQSMVQDRKYHLQDRQSRRITLGNSFANSNLTISNYLYNLNKYR